MKTGNSKTTRKYLLLLVIVCWLPTIFYSVNLRGLVSVSLYTSTIMLNLLAVIYLIKQRQNIVSLLISLIITYLIIYILFNINTLNDGKGMRNYLYIISIFSILFIVNKIKLSYKEMKMFYYIPAIVIILFSGVSLFRSSYDQNSYLKALYLNFQNPNILANALLIGLVYLSLGSIVFSNKRIYKILLLITYIMIIKTAARSALFMATIYLLFLMIKKKNFIISKIVAIIVPMVPLIILISYNIIQQIASLEVFSFMGKSGLSSRDIIWKNVISCLIEDKVFLFFGYNHSLIKEVNIDSDMYKIFRSTQEFLLGNIGSNCHNAYLQFIWNFGIIIFIMYLIIIIIFSIKASKMINDRYGFMAYIGLSIIFVNNSFETHLIDGIIGMAYLSFSLIMLIYSHYSCISRDEV